VQGAVVTVGGSALPPLGAYRFLLAACAAAALAGAALALAVPYAGPLGPARPGESGHPPRW
jgi:hypothetical protein